MNWFDIFVVILLLRTGYIGLKNGLAVEIYKTAGLGFSGLVSFYFYKGVVSFINQYTIKIGRVHLSTPITATFPIPSSSF